MFCHSFEQVDDIFLLNVAHLAVYLGKFWLAVGAKVFVAETFYYLEVTVHARYHKQLLEGLRRLGKGVELPLVHARRYHEVTCPFRSRAHEHRGLYFKKAFAVEIAAYLHGHLVAELKVFSHAITAQVEIPEFHAEVIAAIGVILDGKGRDFRWIEYIERLCDDFDVACGDIGVLVGAFSYLSGNLHDIFTTEMIGCLT